MELSNKKTKLTMLKPKWAPLGQKKKLRKVVSLHRQMGLGIIDNRISQKGLQYKVKHLRIANWFLNINILISWLIWTLPVVRLSHLLSKILSLHLKTYILIWESLIHILKTIQSNRLEVAHNQRTIIRKREGILKAEIKDLEHPSHPH